MSLKNEFDLGEARRRCLRYRRRILEMSRKVTALHIAPAFSCLELTDTIHHGVMRRDHDTFLMSKGHGCLAQYVILEDWGVLSRRDLDDYCTPKGRLGAHPDYGVPGITASTGSLGHGMGIAVGLSYADRIQRSDRRVHVVLSDGELQEGSTWEAMMMAANLGLANLVAYLDLNDFQGLGRTSQTHPKFYPVADKAAAFGWEVGEANGHDAAAILDAVSRRSGLRPYFLIGRTVKGKGVSYMENVPIWHYRSPNEAEFAQAMAGLAEVTG